jgi:hypothetical protein
VTIELTTGDQAVFYRRLELSPLPARKQIFTRYFHAHGT